MSITASPRFLDEGAYGCIHRPPLRCRPPSKMNYKGKVSKLITTEDAKKELAEYVLMDQADPQRQFYLGKPETCPLSRELVNVDPIEKCEMGKDVVNAPEKYRLILMKDGGTNWQKFAAEMNSMASSSPTHRMSMEQFWIETHRMMLGIRTFLANDIVHHDVKAPNIVYDTKKRRMNFIDFGLMETKSKAISECKSDKYQWNRNWWYFPFESILLNDSSYQEGVRGMNQEMKAREFIRKHRFTDDWLKDFIEQTELQGSELEILLQDFVDFLKESSNPTSDTYHRFLSQYFDTLDIYGLGIACLHVLGKTKKFMSNEFVIQAKALFMKMICFHPMKRITIDRLLNEYEQLLESTGIASKHRFTFNSTSHTLEYHSKKQSLSNELLEDMAEEIVDASKKRKRSPEQMSARAEQDPVPTVGRRVSERLRQKREPLAVRRISERLRRKREKAANGRRQNKTMKRQK